jgi:tetratricopeptide (TPR) repeat protein
MAGVGLRSRWPRWPVTLAVVGMIIAGGAAAVAKWPHGWWWLVAIAAVAAAVAPPALAALSQGSQRRQEMRRVARAGLQGIIGAEEGKLPAAGTADLEARVHESVLPIPYIHRDEEDTIRAHMRVGRPVLLIGSSMVGKTKMAARVIAEEFGSWSVAIPDSKTALADLDAKDVALQGSVVWLDDIDRLIGPGGITDGSLRRLAATGNIIVGTIRARAYDQFQPSDQLRPPEWDVLSIFERVFISRDLTRREQERLAGAVADPDIRDRIRTVGLGEYVGAARQVAEALKLGAAGTEPLGYALVLAAADWRRCGMTRPVPGSLLVPLAKPHLDQRNQARLTNGDAFNAGLAWATREINPTVAILQQEEPGTFSVYDYVLDLLSGQAQPVPNASWPILIQHATPSDLLRIGYNAQTIFDQPEVARKAWGKAYGSGDAAVVPAAAVNLGIVLRKEGDLEGARLAFQRAIDSGHSGWAARAVGNLGLMMRDQGDMEGAKLAFQQAIDFGDPDMAPAAAVNLAFLLEDQKNMEGARGSWQRAIDSGHPELTPIAAVRLARLLEEQGDAEGAKTAWQRAIDSGHPDEAPKAAAKLGELLAKQEDAAGAKEAFQRAIDSGHAEFAPMAAGNLGLLLFAQGDMEGAREVWQQAIDSDHAEMALAATVGLGFLLEAQGDMEGAKLAFQRAIDSGHADFAPTAAVGLADLLAEQGDVQGAKAAYEQAINSGDTEAADDAREGLKALRDSAS